MKKIYLVLADGSVFPGESVGADTEALGELVFTTGTCGYLETLTDPCNAGLIVMQTFPQIGNYGVIPAETQGRGTVAGYVAYEICDQPSNFRCEGTLRDWLVSQGIPAITGVDTRAITRHLREHGIMNAKICGEIPADQKEIQAFAFTGAVMKATRTEPEVFAARGEKRFSVTLADYGVRNSLIQELTTRGCEVTAMPARATAEEILAGKPDGIVLSDGPGNPAENAFCIDQIRTLLGRAPLLGVGLGHQMAAIAAGGKTEKMKFGHRGSNQPVKDLETGRTWITSQNHGYAVPSDSLPRGKVRFVNANDGSCEGVDYPEWNAFTTQFDPAVCAGSRDGGFLFDRLISMMGGNEHAEG